MKDEDQSESEEYVNEELEADEGEGEVAALKRKIARLKEELDTAQKERQEYLDGWQRTRADAANASREALKKIASARSAGRDDLALDLITGLDSFDAAMRSEVWSAVDENWRVGMEQVRSQICGALEAHGIQSFGEKGDAYDPSLHEIVSEKDSDEEAHTVLEVIRAGYRTEEGVLRPAHVILSR